MSTLPFGVLMSHKSFRLDAPAFDVLAAQKRLQQIGRFRIGSRPADRASAVDDKGLVEAGLDAVERRAIDLAERLAPDR